MLFDLSTYALFCLGALALIMSPGPDFFYVATRGLAGGRGAGVVSALGNGAGLLVNTALATSALTLLLFASLAAFNIDNSVAPL
ncbi:MAG: LysE family translocator, partial [Armatimonadetes bacterium]|nr:LysE family translocator [Armatimonadota bacterium]